MGRIKEVIKYGYNDISIVPSVISNIEHRSECNPYDNKGFLPIFASPMTTVVNEDNFTLFEENKIIPILPRKSSLETRLNFVDNGKWAAFSLNEFEEIFTDPKHKFNLGGNNMHVLIDIANGHMSKLYTIVTKAKKLHNNRLVIMIGNIANPKTYEIAAKAKVDYVRCSIGTGNGCISSTHTAIHYPMASLISDILEIKEHLLFGNPHMKLPKIIADGGIRGFSDVNKALALGADYVMIGSVLSKALESAAPCEFYTNDGKENHNGIELLGNEDFEYQENGRFTYKGAKIDIYKMFYGMASKKGQEDINSTKKVEEGIVKMFRCEYTLGEWVEKMTHYLRSAMSYTNSRTLEDFKKSEIILNSIFAYEAVNR